MFCLPGMTSYRALFDVLGIPYVGNPPEVMAIARRQGQGQGDRGRRRRAVPAGEVLRPGERPRLPPPVVVKPVDADNSVGVSLVRDAADYHAALTRRSRTARGAGRVVCRARPRGALRHRRPRRRTVCLPLEEYAVDRGRSRSGRDDKLARDRDGDLYLVAKEPTGHGS